MTVSATLMVCDDVRFEQDGKLLVIGVYTGDIAIPQPETRCRQLLFLFSVDGPAEHLPESMEFTVKLPNGLVNSSSIAREGSVEFPEGRDRWYGRQLVAFADIDLIPGKIEASILINTTETIRVTSPWIVIPNVSDAPPPPSENTED